MEFFTESNKPLLEEAASIDFQFMKNGMINYRKHSKKELGLYFIKLAIEKHGNRYGYSKVNYINNSTKVTIACEHHGDFEQLPNNHVIGRKCPKCSGVYQPTTEEWIKRAKEVHGNIYDYSSVHYKSSSKKLTIICPVHGPFEQLPTDHIKGRGCMQCYHEGLKMTTEEFIEKARAVHKDKYDYSAIQYKNNREKVEIICYLHGSFFQTPCHHIYSKAGCPQCFHDSLRMSTEEFIQKAQEVHRGKYDYSSTHYTSSREKLEIKCPIHGSFFQTANSHLQENGCPRCAGNNHDILYLLKCLDTGWYKIGITTGNVQKRITTIGGNIEEVYHVKLADPRKHETILHKRYENAREYNLCVKNGNTEFFSLTEEQVKEVIAYMEGVKNG